MVRTTFTFLSVVAAVVLLTLAAPKNASAQTYSNQVTCVPVGGVSPGNCLDANGFKQSIAVTCGSFPSVNQALAQITDRNGPNRITITGSCANVFVTIVGHNRLTLEGSVTIRSVNIVNSRNITLKSMTVNALTGGPAVTLNGSEVVLDGTTVQGGCCDGGGVTLLGNSILSGSLNALSTITGNFGSGVDVGAGSVFNALNMTISNNDRQGVFAHDGGAVNLMSRARVFPAPAENRPIDISGNGQEGIELEGGTLNMTSGGGLVHIHDNTKTGLDIGNGFAGLEGNILIENNGPGDFGDAEASVGAGTLVFGQGAVVNGPIVALHGTLLFGSGGVMTHTGGVQLLQGSVAAVNEGSTVDGMECDATSWATLFGVATISNSTCPLDAPTGNTSVTDARYLQLTGGTLTGGLTAPSFAGNGAALTALNPANLAAGTAGIDISGNAATSTNAAALGGVLATNYARRDIGNSFTGNQSVTGNISATGSLATGSLSIGNGTAITRHLSATYSLAVPSLKPSTCVYYYPLSFPGAVSGGSDTIALGVPGTFMSVGGFVMFDASEYTADTIVIRVCNVSPNGPASTAATGIIRADLWKH